MSSPPSSTPSNNSVATPDVTRLDFGKLGLPEYRNKWVAHDAINVIDNLFSAQDCQRFLRAAETEHTWSQATHSGTYVSSGKSASGFVLVFRNSSRIIFDSSTLASELFTRVKPYLSSIERLQTSPLHAQFANGIGQYFRKHCDGNYHDPGSGRISYYTLQLYLNDVSPDQGGSTRFWGSPCSSGEHAPYVDVQPKLGRALVFEQAGLLHSGQDVFSGGEKYTIRAELMYEVIHEGAEVVEGDNIAFE
ncbi:hypothetical protein AG1IA_01586 [Rhizoctonia solani AG-1 IA]|uniref:Prolyl 4-hydroxylase alpha subunit domain-containing protein n=1 Tax=Thanatephorus cucumeris (strain AG1-IA) TaxID=983506 RepID=L8X6V8_THACA|nr:hypothetical protein AG1IA_01586 [Rhizoctonia solani AG-1 IA]